jgi:hypothetical protein
VSAAVSVAAVLGAGASLLATPAYAESCPNEALRSENSSLALAACRAFERVTPSFQNGFGSATFEALSPGGEELITLSTPGFAGTESNRLGAYYKMTRTDSGWQTASISPPATRFPGNKFATASADLSRSLWELRSPDESVYAQNLYLREPAGSFVKIGPMVPPSLETGPQANGQQFFLGAYTFSGASADLSQVYFSIHNGILNTALWPGDTTASFQGEGVQGFSLYEYSGVGNTRPALVGVDGQGHLISNCATYLGSFENHEVYNAVSASGDKAFFTAEGHDAEFCPEAITAPEVTEVYARLGRHETVAISEPVVADCSECLPNHAFPAVPRKGAQFQGASADGSKVFFTTTQELLAGAETNNIYEFDFNSALGRRVRRVSIGATAPEVLGVARVSEDGSHVYFVARGELAGANAEGNSPTLGQPNLYVYARNGEHPLGGVSFVATLAEADENDWSSTDLRGVQATPDGRYLVFQSSAPLAGAPGGLIQIFEYDAVSEELIRVSRGQNGYPQGTTNANSSSAEMPPRQSYAGGLNPTTANTFLAITDDGSDVFFRGPAGLTPADEEAEVYEYRSTGPIASGDVFPLSTGKLIRPLGFSRDGRNALVEARGRQLVAGQTDLQENIFDARQDGGFPAPVQPIGCLGEACLQGAPPPPTEPSPPGTLAAGAGNGPPPAPKKKHKKHHAKKHKKHKGKQKVKQRASSKHGGQQ